MVKRKRQRVDTSQSPEAGEAGILSVVVSKVEADPAAPEAPQEAVLVEEDVPDTCLCPLCQEILCHPLITACGHRYCSFCFHRLFAVPRPGDAGRARESRSRDCPMCRQPISLQSGTHALADEERLRKDYPIAYAARELAISREEADLAERGVQYLVLRFGNRHTLIPRARKNKHEWEFFVGLDGGEETRFIDHVEVRLHQAYRPSSLRLEQPPFMTRHRTSTGSEVRALVTFRSEFQRPPLWLVWSLDLQGNGSSQTLEFELQKGGLPSNHDLETGAAVVPSDWWESRGSMLSMLGTQDWQAALLGLMWQSGRWSGPGEASEDDSWTPGEGEDGEESDADWNAGVDEEGEED
ncbi:hypothetical protein ACKKBF_B34495 [Auxenochlorella protothecoides x Auxenochlorella symbiontica]